MVKHVVKREGHQQEYDEKKVYASVYSAALNCHKTDIEAENIAQKVTDKLNNWIKDISYVDSSEIKEEIKKELRKIDVHIEMMYDTHLDLG